MNDVKVQQDYVALSYHLSVCIRDKEYFSDPMRCGGMGEKVVPALQAEIERTQRRMQNIRTMLNVTHGHIMYRMVP